jgi:hypothetical protein
MNNQPHLEYGYKWVLVKDKQGVMSRERQRYNAAGEHLIGYPYVDHEVGFSMHVRLFCQVGFLGGIKTTADLVAQKIGLVMRHDVLSRCEIKPLTAKQISELALPEKPEFIEVYENKAVEPLRSLELLHPLRAPGYPDDIKFIIAQEGRQMEELWGRLERRLGNELYECTLLNQPHQDFGIKAGERIVVRIAYVGKNIVSQAIGPSSALRQTITDFPPE